MKQKIKNVNFNVWDNFLKFVKNDLKKNPRKEISVSCGLELIEGNQHVGFIGRRMMGGEKYHMHDIILRSPIQSDTKEKKHISEERMERLKDFFDSYWEQFKETDFYRKYEEAEKIRRDKRNVKIKKLSDKRRLR